MSQTTGKSFPWLAIGLAVALAFGASAPASAQMGGMSPMGPGMGRPGMGAPHGGQDKDDGPAENAPDAEEKAPDAEESDVGYLDQARRRTKIIEIDGYYRLRTDYLWKMALDQGYNTNPGGVPALPPYPMASECLPSGQVGANGGVTQTGDVVRCGSRGQGSGNMRLRVEPTINISDQVRVRSQLDVFDNLILGSTADSLVNPYVPGQRSEVMQTTSAAPTDVLSNSQNTYTGSIVAKRAWGEIDTQLGSLRFGRMPWHFGRGMYFNSGDCADCNGGTTVDRLMVLTTVYGHQLALAMDFAAQGYHIGYTDLGLRNMGNYPMDLTQKDDTNQYVAALTKIDEPRVWRERIASGDLVVNYGAQVVYRKQDYATFNVTADPNGNYTLSNGNPLALSSKDLGRSLVTNVNALLFIPSLWFKLGWKALTLEFEGNVLAGKLNNAGPLLVDSTGDDKSLRILQAGWVLASQLKLYNDSLFIGFETGGATGDQAELAYDPGRRSGFNNDFYYPHLNYRYRSIPQPYGDHSLNNFHFSPDYHVDEILFRRILGTVSNAIYVKPNITYWLDLDSKKQREVGVTGAVIYSLAPVPVSTPGNSMNYGIELDVGLQYRNLRENIFAGITWGVFWPMAALSRPIMDASKPLWSQPEDANASQVLRTFVGIRF